MPHGQQGRALIVIHLLATATLLLLMREIRRHGALSIKTVLTAGIALRIVLVFAPNFASGDMNRYLWDGQMLLHGKDPYTVPPRQVEWPAQTDDHIRIPRPSDNQDVPTIYPPVALTLFAFASSLGPAHGFFVWKLMMAVFAIVGLVFGIRILQRSALTAHAPLLALSPNVLFESCVEAHVDTVVTTLLLVALACAGWHAPARHETIPEDGPACAQRLRSWIAGATVGLAIATKFTVIFAIFPLAYSMRGTRWRLYLGVASAVIVVYGAAMASGLEPLGSLFVFFRKWRFGSPFFAPLSPSTATGELPWLSLGIATVLGVWLLLALRQHRRSLALLLAVSIPMAASPVVFPWYLLPVAGVLAMYPHPVAIVWLALHPLTYEVIDSYAITGVWSPAQWPLVLLGLGAMFALNASRATPQGERANDV